MTRFVIASSVLLLGCAVPAAAAQLNVSSARPTQSVPYASSPVADAAVAAYRQRIAALDIAQARQTTFDGGTLTPAHCAAFAADRRRIERRLAERARRILPLNANADGSRAF